VQVEEGHQVQQVVPRAALALHQLPARVRPQHRLQRGEVGLEGLGALPQMQHRFHAKENNTATGTPRRLGGSSKFSYIHHSGAIPLTQQDRQAPGEEHSPSGARWTRRGSIVGATRWLWAPTCGPYSVPHATRARCPSPETNPSVRAHDTDPVVHSMQSAPMLTSGGARCGARDCAGQSNGHW
jgi:hypothetical protein